MNFVLQKCSAGQKKSGTANTPDVIAEHLISWSNTYSFLNIEKYNYTTEPFASDGYNIALETFIELEKSGKNWIGIGGDHSVAVSSIGAINTTDTLVLWIDAHADINTFEASKSKNSHGMPVAYLMGLMEKKPKNILLPQNIIYVGLRDLDEFELRILLEMNVRFFSNKPSYQKYSTEEIAIDFEAIYHYIASHNSSRIHISFDVDALDPQEIPSTGTIAQKGLTMGEAITLLDVAKLSGKKIKSADVVELNLDIGSMEMQNKSLDNTLEIINKIIQIVE